MDKAKLTSIPNSPGIYIFKDEAGNILYIGKARSLKKRVRSYFVQPRSLKIEVMSSKVVSLDYIVTKSEIEARLREAELIRRYQPPYNTVFRDDKSFPLICISDEDFPIVWVTRMTCIKRKIIISHYFGPYPDAGILREALNSIRHIFGFRSCFKIPKKACLYYRLGLCPAPCIGKISVQEYRDNINNIILFLEGKQVDLVDRLTASMHRLSDEKRFEEAAQIRNRIQALSRMSYGDLFTLYDSYSEAFELKQILKLDTRPRRIDAFDVSNISGSAACASMVSFYDGMPDKSNYRRFRIKSVTGINDYKMLAEVVNRRYRRILNEKLPLPDLVIIDGGKGQLNTVRRELDNLGITLPVISIAKQNDEIFVSHRQSPIRLKSNSLALRLVQRIRDEAHRFALAYHHILRKKQIIGK